MTQQQELNQIVAQWSTLHLNGGSKMMEFFIGIFFLDCKEAKSSAYHSNIHSTHSTQFVHSAHMRGI